MGLLSLASDSSSTVVTDGDGKFGQKIKKQYGNSGGRTSSNPCDYLSCIGANDDTNNKSSDMNNKNNYSNGKCEYNPFASTVSFKTTVDIPYYILVHGFGQQTE